MSGARARPTRVLLRRLQATGGARLSAAKLETMLAELAEIGVVEIAEGGWRLTPGYARALRYLPESTSEDFLYVVRGYDLEPEAVAA